MADKKPDQADILALNETLTGQVKDLTAQIDSTKGLLTASQAEVADLKAKLTKADADVAALTTERNSLKASQTDFDGKVAAELAKKGIAANAPNTPSKETAGTMSDEQLVTSYSALTDPKAKAEFLEANGTRLRNILKSR
jgi:peptidoglycan hydrolase CwlO-like protein